MSAAALIPFTAPRRPDFGVRFEGARLADGFAFHFAFTGNPDGIVAPPPAPEPARRRRDDLWRRTCFELFAGPAGAESYVEFNLAPNGDWNLYRFDAYRAGMRPFEGDVTVDLVAANDSWRGSVRGTALPAFLGRGSVVLGASAVMEYNDGERAYWSLAHTGDKPDFHRRDAFLLTFPPVPA